MSESIQFRINRKKVIEALVFLAERQPRIDVFHICKVLFFADVNHLRRFGRPILGDQYIAMDDGPVPSFALNVAKRKKDFIGQQWLDQADGKLSVDESDGYVRLTAKDSFDASLFSRSDLECLSDSLARYGKMDFLELWRKVHKEPAWKKHYLGSGTGNQIPLEALLPETMQNRDKAIEQLREFAGVTEL